MEWRVSEPFQTSHRGIHITYGPSCITGLRRYLDSQGLSRALLVSGEHASANDTLMHPLRDALGDRLIGTFAGTRPDKSIASIYEGVEQLRVSNADVLIGVGGGSSLDSARQISAFAADGRPMEEFTRAALRGQMMAPELAEAITPVVAVPTTLAGADISDSGAIEVLAPEKSPSGRPVRTFARIPVLASWFDPNLIATTPEIVLRQSAMNGFNKGLETLYSPHANAMSDASAVHGTRLMKGGLEGLPDGAPEALHLSVVGVILVQLERRISIVHAMSGTLASATDVQQGVFHAILVPHVLRYVFANVEGRRRVLAQALEVDHSAMSSLETADAVVEAVTGVRDRLDLPTRLRDVLDWEKVNVDRLVQSMCNSGFMARSPSGLLPPRPGELADVLEAAA